MHSERPARPESSAAAERAESAARAAPEGWVDAHGDYLFRYALARLRDQGRAEDIVQETFLAALKSRRGFGGRSTERTWLTGILRNKLADHFRRAARETSFTDLDFFAEAEEEMFVSTGASKGAWREHSGPGRWPGDPSADLDRQAFWQAFWSCVEGVPPRVARVFLLRELEDLATDEICRMLDITPSNLWVMLHRARLALRRCLEVNWSE